MDFQEDLICFRSLDKNRIIQAERSSAGHMIPLSDDMYKDAVDSCRPVPSLREDSSSHHWSLLVIERSKHKHRFLVKVGILRNKSFSTKKFCKSM